MTRLLPLLLLPLLLTGCPDSGVLCSEGLTACGNTCVDLQSESAHCGACGQACAQGELCSEGACLAAPEACAGGVCGYDVVATCFNAGQVVGVQAEAALRGRRTPVGSNPQTVARLQDVLVVVDGLSRKLRQVRLGDFSALPEEDSAGAAPNQLLAADPYLYVLNSTSNTLQVLKRTREPLAAPEGGTRFPQGLGLETVDELNFGPNTNPYAMAPLGDALWVSLLGNLGEDPGAGGRVVRVSLADPAHPVKTGEVQLPSGAALRPFPGKSSLAAPNGLAAFGDALYVALSNISLDTYQAAGPGLLARVDPVRMAAETVDLGEGCLGASWVARLGERLLVSCGGLTTYTKDYQLEAVQKTGLVLLGPDSSGALAPRATWSLGCAAGTSCLLPSAGRFATVGERVFVGDVSYGRLFVVDVVQDAFVERRGLSGSAQPPLDLCSRPDPACAGQASCGQLPSLVGDVVAVP
ncbi:hypothetical protein FGE12_05975 [Aggregicoccus sp. 17bor-14]|uniref:hypothetical protein n=1 Tax=Myxococcaceae TaxID=31 RepID=UPI00129C9BE3|nr:MULTISPECIES: hypothetical protein [Myxococcaceae]MBF5041932.1 hypothetical protein [Simulacricoccus sp. 17bor-14]MRI87713.1 hypothetical protein [Aggregicoccus sp. 17bor-14]